MARTSTTPPEKITRADLQRKFQALQDGLRGKVEARRTTIVGALSVGAGIVVLVVFLLGRRSGKRKTTVVEIRRF
jgi:hypothetical protein